MCTLASNFKKGSISINKKEKKCLVLKQIW